MVQRFCIVITGGTNDPVKSHAAVVNGFAQLKSGNKVDFVLMGEAGNIAKDDALRAVSGFGFPPMATLLDDPIMNDPDTISWTV